MECVFPAASIESRYPRDLQAPEEKPSYLHDQSAKIRDHSSAIPAMVVSEGWRETYHEPLTLIMIVNEISNLLAFAVQLAVFFAIDDTYTEDYDQLVVFFILVPLP